MNRDLSNFLFDQLADSLDQAEQDPTDPDDPPIDVTGWRINPTAVTLTYRTYHGNTGSYQINDPDGELAEIIQDLESTEY